MLDPPDRRISPDWPIDTSPVRNNIDPDEAPAAVDEDPDDDVRISIDPLDPDTLDPPDNTNDPPDTPDSPDTDEPPTTDTDPPDDDPDRPSPPRSINDPPDPTPPNEEPPDILTEPPTDDDASTDESPD
jgi:hypothetical protein